MKHAIDLTANACETPGDGRLSRKVMHELLGRIRRGTYPMGSRLPAERELAMQMGVSRPIVREAIMALDLFGMVNSRVGSGTYVTGDLVDVPLLGATSPFELMDSIRVAEAAIIESSCRQIGTAEFARIETGAADIDEASLSFTDWHERIAKIHRQLAHASDNKTMIWMVDQLWTVRRTHAILNQLYDSARRNHGLQAGPLIAPVLDAIRARDPISARWALEEWHRVDLKAVLGAYSVQIIQRAKEEADSIRDRYLTR